MDLQTAIELQKKIANQFLFSRQIQLAFADGWDDNVSPGDLVYDIFNEIFGVGIAGTIRTGFHIELLTTERELYMAPVRQYYGLSNREIVSLTTSPFTLFSRKRPIEMGCSLGHRLNDIRGTLGCFVRGDHDNNTYVLSNHHVLYNQQDFHDNFIVQPSKFDGGTSADTIGEYIRSLPFDHSNINECDAAIAGPIVIEAVVKIPGKNGSVHQIIEAQNGQKVYKYGATTGLTFGKITNFVTGVKVRIEDQLYDFTNQIRIEGFEEDFTTRKAFSQEGDSGSLIIDYETDAAVGLLFAGNKQGITLANPIGPVLTGLGVRL